MPRTLTLALRNEKNQVSSTGVFLWLFEVDSADFPIPIRFVSDVQSIVYQGVVFDPFPVDVNEVAENVIGEKQVASVTAANVDQQVISLLNTYWDAIAEPLWFVKIWQVLREFPDEVPLGDAETYEVMSAETDLVVVQFEMEQVALPTSQRTTGRRYTSSGGFPGMARVGRLF